MIDMEYLITKTPPQFRSFVSMYGPPLLRLAIDELLAVHAMLLQGDVESAYAATLKAMTADEYEAEINRSVAADIAAADENAASVKAKRNQFWTASATIIGMILAVI